MYIGGQKTTAAMLSIPHILMASAMKMNTDGQKTTFVINIWSNTHILRTFALKMHLNGDKNDCR